MSNIPSASAHLGLLGQPERGRLTRLMPKKPKPSKKPARKRWEAPPEHYPTVTITIELGPRVLNRLKFALVRTAIIECGGNITRAAALLGTHRQSLQRMLDDSNEES